MDDAALGGAVSKSFHFGVAGATATFAPVSPQRTGFDEGGARRFTT